MDKPNIIIQLLSIAVLSISLFNMILLSIDLIKTNRERRELEEELKETIKLIETDCIKLSENTNKII